MIISVNISRLKMAKSKKPVRIKSALNRALVELGISDELPRWRLVKDFGKIVGDRIATHAEAFKTADGILYVRVDGPSWMNQLYLIKEDIIEKLNEAAGRNFVKDIKFFLKN